ncbi:hypothetical protein CCACVL1_21358 [Corchorus capsularis]|uniref:Uncharacterized protein n=1 Tax=Corchorus capsularis TaxID=210143 RepID=A0A1R3H6J1_COCAP|nr:hypothetical protein CCACVL1_21358 [Corchorus capsularis]
MVLTPDSVMAGRTPAQSTDFLTTSF